MAKGRQTESFEFLGSYSDADYVGAPLCEDVEFRFDLYAPVQKGAGAFVGFQSGGRGAYDFVIISPGLHVEVFVAEDGGAFEQVATWNVTGPIMVDVMEDGGSAADFRGHGLISDPYEGGTPGVAFLKHAVGNYAYEADAAGDAVLDLTGHGRIEDLADLFC